MTVTGSSNTPFFVFAFLSEPKLILHTSSFQLANQTNSHQKLLDPIMTSFIWMSGIQSNKRYQNKILMSSSNCITEIFLS